MGGRRLHVHRRIRHGKRQRARGERRQVDAVVADARRLCGADTGFGHQLIAGSLLVLHAELAEGNAQVGHALA
ncbi:hypothetical protein D3C72_2250020 [compost metagenome]